MPQRTSQLLLVFFASHAGLPKLHEVKARLVPALESHLGEPLLSTARDFVSNRLEIGLAKREELPPLPISLLRHTGLSELEERKLDNSSLALIIEAVDDNRPPRTGLWTAVASAHAAAALLNGTIFDPAASRILKRVPAQTLSSDGRIAVARHIVVPFSIGERGLGWMTTTGMLKFGVSDLEVRDVPPNLQGMAHLVNATAQHLVDLIDRRPSVEDEVQEVDVPRELLITDRDRAESVGRSESGERQTLIGLQHAAGSSPKQPPFLRLVRPRSASGSHGEWLNAALEELLGAEREVRNVQTASQAMQQAHARAIAELERVKLRFARGLAPGENLYVKHGFPAAGGQKEYMWLVVTSWAERHVHGQLVNTARSSALRAGHEVDIEEGEIFDWMLQLANGERDGGYTSEVALRDGFRDAELGSDD